MDKPRCAKTSDRVHFSHGGYAPPVTPQKRMKFNPFLEVNRMHSNARLIGKVGNFSPDGWTVLSHINHIPFQLFLYYHLSVRTLQLQIPYILSSPLSPPHWVLQEFREKMKITHDREIRLDIPEGRVYMSLICNIKPMSMSSSVESIQLPMPSSCKIDVFFKPLLEYIIRIWDFFWGGVEVTSIWETTRN